jgi:glycyl-tRNA synthetase
MEIGVPEEKQRFIEKAAWERAHYSVQGFDQEIYLDRWGWTEVSGHNYRTDYDLRRHMEFSGVDMRTYKEYEKPVTKEEVVAKPVMSTLGRAFKNDAPKIAKTLSTLDPKMLEESLKKKGFYQIETFKILPAHVEILRRKVEEKGRRFVPHVVEPSFGSDRLTYIALEYAYRKQEDRVLLSFPKEIAPIQVAIFPLVNKDGLPEKARQVYDALLSEGFTVEYDESGSIGRRYARADEVGTPLGLTIDYKTLEDNTVTLRDRDTWAQVRTEITKLPILLNAYFREKIGFRDLGKIVKG